MSKIVFMGDSITQGVRTGVTASQIFSYLIGNQRGFTTIVNKGVPNDTAAGGLTRLQADVINENPDSLVLMFGTNDVFNGVSVASFKADMTSIIQQAKAANIEVVLFFPPMGRSTNQLNAFPPYLIALQEIAFTEGVASVDIYRRFLHDYFYMSSSAFTGMYTDWAHLSAAGHARIAEIFYELPNSNSLTV